MGYARDGAALGGLRVLIATGAGLHALATVFLLLPEVGLLGGVHARNDAPPPALAIGDLQTINVSAAVKMLEHPSADDIDMSKLPAPDPVLLVGDSRAWLFQGKVYYSTVFNRSLISDALRQKDPAAAIAFLRARGIRFVWINWSEVDRLRRDYAFDPAITPEAFAPWATAGAAQIPLDHQGPNFRGITLLRLP